MHTTLPNSSVLETSHSKFGLDGCVGFERFAGCRVCSLVAWYHALELRHDSKHSSSHLWQDSCRQLCLPLMNFIQIIVSCVGLVENFSGASCGNSSCGPLGFRVWCRSPSFPNTTSETTCQSTHGGVAWIIRATDNKLHCFGDFLPLGANIFVQRAPVDANAHGCHNMGHTFCHVFCTMPVPIR